MVSGNDSSSEIINEAHEQLKINYPDGSLVQVISDKEKEYSADYNPSCEDLILENPEVGQSLTSRGVISPCVDCNPPPTTTTTCSPESPECTTIEPDPSGCFFAKENDLDPKEFIECKDFSEREADCPIEGNKQTCYYALDSDIPPTDPDVKYSCCQGDKCNNYVEKCCPPGSQIFIVENELLDSEVLIALGKNDGNAQMDSGEKHTLICLPTTTTTTTTTTCDPNDTSCTTTTTTCDPNDTSCTTTITTTLSPTTTKDVDPCCLLSEMSDAAGQGPIYACTIEGLPSCFNNPCSNDEFCQFIEVSCDNPVDDFGDPILNFCKCESSECEKCYKILCTTTTTPQPTPPPTEPPTTPPCDPELDPLCTSTTCIPSQGLCKETTTPDPDPTTGPPPCNNTWLLLGGACPPTTTTTTTCDPNDTNCTTTPQPNTTTTTCDPSLICNPNPPQDPRDPGNCDTFYRWVGPTLIESGAADPFQDFIRRFGVLGKTATTGLDSYCKFALDIFDDNMNYTNGTFFDPTKSFNFDNPLVSRNYIQVDGKHYTLDIHTAYTDASWEWTPISQNSGPDDYSDVVGFSGPLSLWAYHSYLRMVGAWWNRQGGPQKDRSSTDLTLSRSQYSSRGVFGGGNSFSHNGKCPSSSDPEHEDACWQLNGSLFWLDKSFTRKSYFYSVLSDLRRCAPDPDVCHIWTDPNWKKFEFTVNYCMNPSVAKWCLEGCFSFMDIFKRRKPPLQHVYRLYHYLLTKESVEAANYAWPDTIDVISKNLDHPSEVVRNQAKETIKTLGVATKKCCFETVCPYDPWCSFEGYGAKYDEVGPQGLDILLILNIGGRDGMVAGDWEFYSSQVVSVKADEMYCMDKEVQLKAATGKITAKITSGHYLYPSTRVPRSSKLIKKLQEFTIPGPLKISSGDGTASFNFTPPLTTSCYNSGLIHNYQVYGYVFYVNIDDLSSLFTGRMLNMDPEWHPLHAGVLNKATLRLKHYAFKEVYRKPRSDSEDPRWDYYLSPRNSTNPEQDSIYKLPTQKPPKTGRHRWSYRDLQSWVSSVTKISCSIGYSSSVLIIDTNDEDWITMPWPPCYSDFTQGSTNTQTVVLDEDNIPRSLINTRVSFYSNPNRLP